jgi:Ca2+-binding RTX toxin-like protein
MRPFGVDYIFTSAKGTWSASNLIDFTGDGLIDYVRLSCYETYGNSFTLEFGTEQIGQNLAAGVYLNAKDAMMVIPGSPGLSFMMNSTGYGPVSGKFTIYSIDIDYSGATPVLKSLSMSFSQSSGPGGEVYTGSFRYNRPVNTLGEQVTERANEGTDTVISSVSYVLPANVENLTLNGTAAINGTGNALNNTIIGNAANNALNGGAGADRMIGGAGNDILNGGTGADRMIGGSGNDTYYVDHIGDAVFETSTLPSGIDRVISFINHTLRANVENLTLSGTAAINGTGNELDNIIVGNDADNILTGGLGMDTLTGGLGADTFDFNAIAESAAGANCDVITDFVCGTDKIDLSTIDAMVGAGTDDDAFTFIDTAAFSGAGQLRFENGVLYGNVDADLGADFQIALTGVATFAATDVLL